MKHYPLKHLDTILGPARVAAAKKRANQKLKRIFLAEVRKQLGLTQTSVAKAMGVSQSALSQFESQDDMQLSTLRRLVEALGGELLCASIETKGATPEDDVGDDAAATVLGKDAYLVASLGGNELNVLEARGLGDLVVQADNPLFGLDLADVDFKVADLAIEVGRVDVVLLIITVDTKAVARVFIGRQDTETNEAL